MSRIFGKVLCATLLLSPVAMAATGDDYASRWPLQAQGEDGAYRVVLDAGVYRQLQSPTLADMVVVDATDKPVATALFPPDAPLVRASKGIDVPWFALPAQANAAIPDIAAISEIATDGSLRRVELSGARVQDASAGEHGFLLDLSQLREPITALRLQWSDREGFERTYSVSASDDLKQWREVVAQGQLLQLQNNGRRIVEDRIGLGQLQARYLRLLPVAGHARALGLTAVRAEPANRADAPVWQWRELAGRRVEQQGKLYFEYELDGRFPVQQADVTSAGNNALRWTLQSRDDSNAQWHDAAAPWMAFQLGAGAAGSNRSPPQALAHRSRDRYWRLRAGDRIAGAAPVLRLAYQPEVVVFVAEGTGPYALLAGSARAQRADAPLQDLVQQLRQQRGQEWQPATASLGAMQTLAGAAALQPQRDWKTWLLWGLLIAGALLVAGFAFSLLRGKPAN